MVSAETNMGTDIDTYFLLKNTNAIRLNAKFPSNFPIIDIFLVLPGISVFPDFLVGFLFFFLIHGGNIWEESLFGSFL